ncbi:MAG TPA: TRAP transporter fused permease subunit [Burkholderiales bacterium]
MNAIGERAHGTAERARDVLSLALATLLVAGSVYTSFFGIYDDILVRVGGLALGLYLVLVRPAAQGRLPRLRALVDSVLIVAFGAVLFRYFQIAELLETGLYFPLVIDVALGVAGIVVLLELTRRAVGLPLVLVCVLAIGYALFGDSLGGMLSHAGVTLPDLMMNLWYSFDGVFGRPIAVVTGTIIIYIVFGAMVEGLGVGDVLLKLSIRGLGWLPGGAAHAAVLASAMFGTISGSAVANVVGTGVVTIPMIKRSGFSARFAGAVEAAASSGGQIMPPVMGAVAFIMADMTGVPYLYVCLAALFPALFYYGSLFACVAAEARRLGIKPAERAALPTLTRQDWLMVSVFLLPLAMIVLQLVRGVSPARAGGWALVTAVVLGLVLNPGARSFARFADALKRAGAASAMVLIAVGAVGIVVGVMNMTGLGLRFASFALELTQGSLVASLLMMAAACLALGMGMPTVPAYLVIILVMGPAVEALGVSTLSAHMFVVYFAVMSAITPPVALAAYAAAPIAEANPMGVGATAVRLSLLGFLVPFAFAYNPSLLLIGDFSWAGFAWAVLKLFVAGWLLSAMSARGTCWTMFGVTAAIVILVPPEAAVQASALGIAVAAEIACRLGLLGTARTRALTTAGDRTT